MTQEVTRKKNLLIVDDDRVVHFLIEKLILSFDWINRIEKAYSGSQALEILLRQCDARARLPDIVVLDIEMPGMNGFQFLESCQSVECLRHERKPVIIMVSSSVDPSHEHKAKALGVRHFFSKPLNVANICQALKEEFF